MDCGAACLRMAARFHGRYYSLEYLRDLTNQDREGVSMRAILEAAEAIGLNTLAAEITYEQLSEDVPLPAIVHWGDDHFVLVYRLRGDQVWMADPASGKRKISRREFLSSWLEEGEENGVVLLLEPSPAFYELEGEGSRNTRGWRYLLPYFKRYRSLFWQLLATLLLSIVLQLVFPFILQAIVDYGIARSNISLIWMLLLAHLLVFMGRVSVDVIRNRLILHIGERVHIHLMSDFLSRLLRMPMRFFETRLRSDVFRRIADSGRLERFLSRTFLHAAFSIIQLLVFGLVLLIYSWKIFLVFLGGTGLYLLWIQLFMRRRSRLDARLFSGEIEGQGRIVEMLEGMADLRNFGAGRDLRWRWEQVQAAVFRSRMGFRRIEQWQVTGGAVIEEIKILVIILISAQAVIAGQLTLGMLLAVMYIIGQLSAPVGQLLRFLQQAQEAGISLERMREILQHDPRTEPARVQLIPERAGIFLENVTFAYGGDGPTVLQGLSTEIPYGRRTAVTGESGGGKSTLLKLLLGYYPPAEGRIRLQEVDLKTLKPEVWQQRCGAILQESRLFSDTLARNVALGQERIDRQRLLQAVRLAHLQPLIDRLPLGLNTPVGRDGTGLSRGQEQQVLLARLIYFNPEYLLMDEVTSSLDPFQEMMIWDELCEFFSGKTFIYVTHRLHALRSADQILVMRDGLITEVGTHDQLLQREGYYTFLMRNQVV